MALAPALRSSISSLLFWATWALLATWALPARADRDLGQSQGTEWVGKQYALLSGLTLSNVAAMTLGQQPTSARTDIVFFGDAREEANLSPLAPRLSDITLSTTVLAPLCTLAPWGGTAFGNALLIYAEALEISLLANTLTKRAVRRARPYTHGPGGADRARAAGADAYYSFYSGHSALSFTAATSSSLLFAALSEENAWRTVHFATSFALAGFTAEARVRGGKHYPSDIAVGMAVGVAVGWAVPAAHRVAFELSPQEVGAALGGAALGFASALLLPRSAGPPSKLALPEIEFLPGGAVLRWDLSRTWSYF